MKKLYLIQKRKLEIKEITVDSNTFVKAIDIGKTIFFDREQAQAMLDVLIYLKNLSAKGVKTKIIGKFVAKGE